MKRKKTKSIAQLRDELARQILEFALKDDNPQYKLDAFKATVERGKAQAQAPVDEPTDTMTTFMTRVRQAAVAGAEPDGAEQPTKTDSGG